MKFIVLAGGSGTRLWPLSRKCYPKQFLKLKFKDDTMPLSFFQRTLKRLLLYPEAEIFIVTNEEYKFYVYEQIREVFNHSEYVPNIEIVFEPVPKNTAPAIALALKYAVERKSYLNENFCVCPSDHLIYPEQEFLEYLHKADKLAKDGYIITFGVVPNRPETGYGYIKVNKHKENEEFYQVDKFVEKPNLETAIKYLKEGYYWNSGIFAFNASCIIEEFKSYIPQLAELINIPSELLTDYFYKLPDISIDYAVAEKTKKALLIPLKNIFWSDIGSWDSLYDILDKDSNGNVVIGEFVNLNINTKNTLIVGSGKRLVVNIGLTDLIIVDTEDALLISKKNESQKVKEVVSILLEEKLPQVEEHVTSYRPWGSFTVLEEGPKYKIKKITVKPETSLCFQLDHYKSKHWIVVKGNAKAKLGNRELFLHENGYICVPKNTPHILENLGKVNLEIIEIQIRE